MKTGITVRKLVELGFVGRDDFMWKGNIGIQIMEGSNKKLIFYLACKDISNAKFVTFRELKSIEDLEFIYFAIECKQLK
jgi:hypothetical protein